MSANRTIVDLVAIKPVGRTELACLGHHLLLKRLQPRELLGRDVLHGFTVSHPPWRVAWRTATGVQSAQEAAASVTTSGSAVGGSPMTGWPIIRKK
jgi:hypothetical protein